MIRGMAFWVLMGRPKVYSITLNNRLPMRMVWGIEMSNAMVSTIRKEDGGRSGQFPHSLLSSGD